MMIIGAILNIGGWFFNGSPLMLLGIILFIVALCCYYVAYKLLKEMMNGHM
jgi:hypothetical protein